jgi:hypothetical protein
MRTQQAYSYQLSAISSSTRRVTARGSLRTGSCLWEQRLPIAWHDVAGKE